MTHFCYFLFGFRISKRAHTVCVLSSAPQCHICSLHSHWSPKTPHGFSDKPLTETLTLQHPHQYFSSSLFPPHFSAPYSDSSSFLWCLEAVTPSKTGERGFPGPGTKSQPHIPSQGVPACSGPKVHLGLLTPQKKKKIKISWILQVTVLEVDGIQEYRLKRKKMLPPPPGTQGQ